MFHDLLTFFRECVPLSITSIVTFNASSVHVPILVFGVIRFTCAANILFCGLEVGGKFSLLPIGFVIANPTCCFVSYEGLSSS